jgi:hypothetical protein
MKNRKVTLRHNPPLDDFIYVAANMRERDREEIFATRYGNDPVQVARDAKAGGEFAWVAYVDGLPAAAIGALPRWPRVWTVWAYGTDQWDTVVLALTRHVKRFMIPAIFNAGAIRADACALEKHEDARRWLEYLGAVAEKPLDNWGKNGERFVLYCWTRERTKRTLINV